MVVEFSALQGLFSKRKEQHGAGHFLKARVEKKATKKPWL